MLTPCPQVREFSLAMKVSRVGGLASLLPTVTLLDYLAAVGRTEPGFTGRAREVMQLGYQRQLVYRYSQLHFCT